LDEVDDTSILKTGTQPRYPRSPSWLMRTGPAACATIAKRFSAWHHQEAFVERENKFRFSEAVQTSFAQAAFVFP
jgi:hypothetical protein